MAIIAFWKGPRALPARARRRETAGIRMRLGRPAFRGRPRQALPGVASRLHLAIVWRAGTRWLAIFTERACLAGLRDVAADRQAAGASLRLSESGTAHFIMGDAPFMLVA